jgi:hypothetical protein
MRRQTNPDNNQSNPKQQPAKQAATGQENLPAWMTEETWSGYLEIERY